MRRMLLASVCAVNLAGLFGQGLTLVGSGYANPTLIRVTWSNHDLLRFRVKRRPDEAT